jgi:hypothetical protein
VRLADPFGLVELARSFSLTDTLTVTPAIVALPHSRLTGAWTGGGDSRARTVSSAGRTTWHPASTGMATTCAGCTGGPPPGTGN